MYNNSVSNSCVSCVCDEKNKNIVCAPPKASSLSPATKENTNKTVVCATLERFRMIS